ncbi:MAG TPA: 2-dehydro-3-deoxy-6-phosphogalactonate aldolase [Steroidobacteraceae bacterium]|nr:2-dehydro-3-deoxy-6-phosphogalactonate aldolase [Steroidobacteraceae bacterium]
MHSEAAPGEDALVAILRGVAPARVAEIARVLYGAGIRTIEVPLNSPDPFSSIATLAAGVPSDCLVGAGTVLNADDVDRTHAAGGRLVVAPNVDIEVISRALQLGMRVLPGIATATEAFTAIRAGATQLKLFPAASYGPRHLQALRTVLPPGTGLLPVGGVTAEHIPDWLAAGATGFGFGSELFRPEYSVAEVERRAQLLVQSFRAARRRLDVPAATTITTKTGGTA